MGLQAVFELSKKLGTEGRIYLTSKKKETSLREPAPFYEHCGFKGNTGTDGGKYFNPTPKNIQILFSKVLHPFFEMKEISIQQNENSFVDCKTGKIRIPKILKKLMDRQKS